VRTPISYRIVVTALDHRRAISATMIGKLNTGLTTRSSLSAFSGMPFAR
jgi:hypothetical protein